MLMMLGWFGKQPQIEAADAHDAGLVRSQNPKLSQRSELSQLILMIQAHDAGLVRCLSPKLGPLMLMMLGWFGAKPQIEPAPRIEPADAHDAGLVRCWSSKFNQLMLMMLGWFGAKTANAASAPS